MADDKIIAVIQAHKEGKKIEWRLKDVEDAEWQEYKNEDYNFQMCEYRINPEPHYRPFKSADEAMKAIKEHGSTVLTTLFKFPYQAAVNLDYIILYSKEVDSGFQYKFGDDTVTDNFTFRNGTPFGKLEEE